MVTGGDGRLILMQPVPSVGKKNREIPSWESRGRKAQGGFRMGKPFFNGACHRQGISKIGPLLLG